MGLLDVFHKKTPEELAKEWKKSLKAETRNMDRNIRKIEMVRTHHFNNKLLIHRKK